MSDKRGNSDSTSGTVGSVLYLKRSEPGTFSKIAPWILFIGIIATIWSSINGLHFGWGVFLTVLILLIVFANDYLNPRSTLSKFLESHEQVTATVVTRRFKEHSDSYGDSSYTYFLTVGFDHAGTPVELEARVNKKVYNMHREGSQLKVRYAAGNPRIALMQGEFDRFF
jgi:hypothetical protein